MRCRISLESVTSMAQLGEMWRDLELRSIGSFFTSWTWIGTWLGGLPPEVRPEVLVARTSAGRVVGLGVVVRRRRWRFGLPVRVSYLNETGVPQQDAITIEYNGFRIVPELADELARQMIEALMSGPHGADEVRLSGMLGAEGLPAHALQRRGMALPSYRVQLDEVRASCKPYLSFLRQSARSNIRRAVRRLESTAPVTLTLAGTLEEAQDYHRGLIRLHNRHWHARGQPGAFGSDFQRTFHDRLLVRAFERGELVMLAVWHGEHPLGYLQFFTDRGTLHLYQSGLDYARYPSPDSPGLVAHSLAIERFLADGWACYDFMAGDYLYKRALATHHSELAWRVLSRDTWKMRTVEHLHATALAWRARWRSMANRPEAAPAPTLPAASTAPLTMPAPLAFSEPRTPTPSP